MEKMESRGTFTEYLPSYTIGVDAYKSVLHIVKRFGKNAVVIGGPTAMEKARPKLEAALAGSEVSISSWISYGTNSTHANAKRIAAMPEVIAADMLFLVGGGRAIDEGKEIATILDKPYFTFPTLASNCAPVTRIAVFYKEDGSADTYFIPAELPVHTFIDTQIIAESPDEYFWAGIGDAFLPEKLSCSTALLWDELLPQVPALSLCLIMQSRHWQISALVLFLKHLKTLF